MTEAEVRKTGRKALIGKRPMTKVGRAMEKGETQGFMKILVDADTTQILGAAMLGTGGDEAIHSHPGRHVRDSAVHGDSARHAYSSDRLRADSDHAG